MSQQRAHGRPRGARSWVLAFAVLGSAVAWGGHLVVTYSVVPTLCELGLAPLLHVFTLIFLALAIGSGVVALGVVLAARASALLSLRWRGGQDEPLQPARESDRFLGGLGVVLTAVFATAIVVQGTPALGVDPCALIA